MNNDDIYFQKKAEEINDKIRNYQIDHEGKRATIGDIEKIIYLGLKEVARDQRYSCVDAVGENLRYSQVEQNELELIIQNAQIKGETK